MLSWKLFVLVDVWGVLEERRILRQKKKHWEENWTHYLIPDTHYLVISFWKMLRKWKCKILYVHVDVPNSKKTWEEKIPCVKGPGRVMRMTNLLTLRRPVPWWDKPFNYLTRTQLVWRHTHTKPDTRTHSRTQTVPNTQTHSKTAWGRQDKETRRLYTLATPQLPEATQRALSCLVRNAVNHNATRSGFLFSNVAWYWDDVHRGEGKRVNPPTRALWQ